MFVLCKAPGPDAAKTEVARIGSAWGAAQVKMPVNRLGQSLLQGQGGRKEQPGIGHQTVVVKGDVDAVGVVAW